MLGEVQSRYTGLDPHHCIGPALLRLLLFIRAALMMPTYFLAHTSCVRYWFHSSLLLFYYQSRVPAFPLFCFFFFSSPSSINNSPSGAQLVSWDLTSANPAVSATVSGSSATSSITAGKLSFGSGLNPVNITGWRFTNWPNSTTGATQYIAWDLTPSIGQPVQINLVQLGFDVSVSTF